MKQVAKIVAIIGISLLSIGAMAAPYGEGSYGQCAYGSADGPCNAPTTGDEPVITIPTPFGNLPVTGPTLWAIVGAGTFGASIGAAVWAHQRRKQRLLKT